MACVRVRGCSGVRITDGRTREEWTTAILDDQTDSGEHVRELADAAEEVTGPLTCTAQAADGSVARIQPAIVIFESEAPIPSTLNIHAFPVYHCGARILNNHRALDVQIDDWKRIGNFLGRSCAQRC
jgi:hypothetical protein